jgi:1-acyl-sn-glycerol-3-phosphate acyltransferase
MRLPNAGGRSGKLDGVSRLRKPKAGFWIRLVVVILYPIDSLLYRTRWHHLDRIPPPEAGGAILAFNHVSIVETMLMAKLVWQSGRIPRIMAKASLWDVPIIGTIFRGCQHIPVDRSTTSAADALHPAVEALQRGEAIVIYPEGTVTHDPDGWPMQARTGIARLALLSPDTPVIPIGQWGAHKRGFDPRRLFRRPLCEASVGEPVDLSRFRGTSPTAQHLREITDVIMSRVRDEVAVLRDEPAPEVFVVPTKHPRHHGRRKRG